MMTNTNKLTDTEIRNLCTEVARAGDLRMAAFGLALHFCVAFGWSAVFYALSRRLGFLTQHAVVSRLEAITTNKNIGTVLKYMQRVNKEFEVIWMKACTERDKSLIETSVVTSWLQQNHGYLV
jgi:hypothetical protein